MRKAGQPFVHLLEDLDGGADVVLAATLARRMHCSLADVEAGLPAAVAPPLHAAASVP